MPEKLVEHTYGTHIYMKMRLDNKRIEAIDVYLRNDGEHYVTSADHGMELCSGENLKQRQKLRQEIIDAFNELYQMVEESNISLSAEYEEMYRNND